MIFFAVTFSFKKIALNTVTKIYPEESNMGPIERGIPLYAYTDINVAIKKIK